MVGSADWSGLDRRQLIIASGPDSGHGFLLSGFQGDAGRVILNFMGSELQDVIFNLIETVPVIIRPEALFLRPFGADLRA